MKPVSPVMPGMDVNEVVIAKDQPEYIPLPAVVLAKAHGTPVMTRWRLTDEERELIKFGHDVVLTQMTFGGPLQPVHLQVVHQEDVPNVDHLGEPTR